MSSEHASAANTESQPGEMPSLYSKREYIPAPEGASAAAILVFLHMALIGYLGYACVHLVRHWDVHVVIQHNMTWQYYLPAWLAALSYFPTDSLTRIVAIIARIAGVVALLMAVGLLVPALLSGHPSVPIGRVAFMLLLGWPAALVCCWVRRFLPVYRRK